MSAASPKLVPPLLALVTSASCGLLSAQESSDELSLMHEPVTGDWAGTRTLLEEMGLSFEFYYTADVFSNVSGGIRRRTVYMGNADLLALAELEPLVGWRGGRLFLYGLGVHGDSISAHVGDLQLVGNIDTLGIDTWKLYEAWFEQDFLDDRLSILFGLYDLNSEIDVIPSAGLFLNSSFGIGADFGLSGRNGPSIFPTTSLGTRIELRPSESVYVRTAVLDGVAGDPDDPFGTQVILKSDDGLLIASEIGFIRNPEPGAVAGDGAERRHLEPRRIEPPPLRQGYFGKYAAGVWGYTTEFDDFTRVDASGQPRERRGTYGVYVLGEQRVYHEAADPVQGLALFARLGIADERVNPVDAFLGGGIVYRGLIPGRDLDRAGVAVAAAHFGTEFRDAMRLAGVDQEEWEVTLEVTYRARLTPWLTFQPDLQYVFQPAGDADIDDAVVLAARFVLAF